MLAVFPAIGAKVVSGLHMGPAKSVCMCVGVYVGCGVRERVYLCVFAVTRWVVGWAMVGRAEFAYFIAESAVNGSEYTLS